MNKEGPSSVISSASQVHFPSFTIVCILNQVKAIPQLQIITPFSFIFQTLCHFTHCNHLSFPKCRIHETPSCSHQPAEGKEGEGEKKKRDESELEIKAKPLREAWHEVRCATCCNSLHPVLTAARSARPRTVTARASFSMLRSSGVRVFQRRRNTIT